MTERLDSPQAESPRLADGTMGILDHLHDLRIALLYSIISIGVCSALTIYFAGDIFRILTLPLMEIYDRIGHDQKLIFTSPPEGFMTYLRIGVFSGFLTSTPLWMFFMGRFIWLGLYAKEKKVLMIFVGFGSALFLLGGLFGYFYIFPIGLRFLVENYRTATLEALISVKEYFSFASKLIVAFGLAFELPLIMFLLGRLGLVSARGFLRAFRWVVVVIFIVAAIFTPPDAVSQISMAVPLCVLYFLGVLAVAIFGKKKPRDTQ